MQDSRIRIVVDGMGGDNAPWCTVQGAVEALKERDGFDVILTGDEAALNTELAKYDCPKDRLTVHPTTEVIEMAEPPVDAIRHKRDSSIVVGLMMVRRGEAEAFVSAGSTGAVLVGGQLVVGRMKGIERSPLAVFLPTERGLSCLVDCGANVDARPDWLVQFAHMGSIYTEQILGIKNPRVGLLNIGAEEEKGNALVKETMPLLKAEKDLNFIGSVEARDVPLGGADVVVTDAFSGNVLLKSCEGTARALVHILKKNLLSSFKSKIGALLIKKSLRSSLMTFDTSTHGGAPLLGLKGLVIKTHGSSKDVEIRNSILQCLDIYDKDINGKIRAALERKAAEEARAREASGDGDAHARS